MQKTLLGGVGLYIPLAHHSPSLHLESGSPVGAYCNKPLHPFLSVELTGEGIVFPPLPGVREILPGRRIPSRCGREIFSKIPEPFTKVGETLSKIGEIFSKIPEPFTKVGQPLSKIGQIFSEIPEMFTKVGERSRKIG